MNSVQERLRHWRQVKGLSLRELQEAVNAHLAPPARVSLGTVSNYERPPQETAPRPGPRTEFVAALKAAFPELRLEWLLLGEGQPTVAGARVAAVTGEGAAGRSDSVLAGRVLERFPDLAFLSPEAAALFLGALTRYATGAPRMDLGEEQILELAGDLRWLLLLPLRSWGFDHEPGYERFSAYSVAMLHALTLAMPDAGRGDPISALAESPLRRLREASPGGLGGEGRGSERG